MIRIARWTLASIVALAVPASAQAGINFFFASGTTASNAENPTPLSFVPVGPSGGTFDVTLWLNYNPSNALNLAGIDFYLASASNGVFKINSRTTGASDPLSPVASDAAVGTSATTADKTLQTLDSGKYRNNVNLGGSPNASFSGTNQTTTPFSLNPSANAYYIGKFNITLTGSAQPYTLNTQVMAYSTVNPSDNSLDESAPISNIGNASLAVPEPSSLLVIGAPLIGLAMRRRRSA